MNIPKDLEELKYKCKKISGKSIGDLTKELNISPPTTSLNKTKGWFGQILEIYLGANAANKSLPDFVHLGIELKTLPLNNKNQPKESTYVCTAPLHATCTKHTQHTTHIHTNTYTKACTDNTNGYTEHTNIHEHTNKRRHTNTNAHTNINANKKYEDNTWENSRVKKKLSHVLWVPIEGNTKIPIKDRIIGTAFLWKPSKQEEKILKSDWEELTNMLYLGEVENLSAKYGKYLQIRPKASNSKELIDTIDKNGNIIKVVPKGFYLRASFTKEILKKILLV